MYLMSTLPDNELDLEKLFLPAWAQEGPSAAKYANFEGFDERPDRRSDRRGPRPPRRDGPSGPRREGNRPPGERRPQRGPDRGGGRPQSGPRHERGGRPGGFQGGERREPPAPLPQLNASLIPEEKGVESLSRQIKMTGRAYPLFDIAQMILQKPERHAVAFSIRKNAEGQPIQPLFLCALDDTLWLSEDEAVAHVLKRHFATFYQAEKTATEPPKGKYTFVAQCGMSGVVLGPPNHHDYQNQLRKLHAERYSRLPFEVYKSRVKIVRDEEVVKKWVEDQSWKTEYLCLNMPEATRLENMEAVERHFRESHKDNIIKPVEAHTLSGVAARNLRSPELARLVRSVWEDQKRFPLQIATVLSQQFAGHGLQFFKVNKTITHVSVARPHYLDMALTPVSEGVKHIVEYINSHAKCTRRQLVEALAPTPAAPAVLPVEPQPAPMEGQVTPAPAPSAATAPTPEQTAVIADLHWLIHEGHVIEFANGTFETAKKPLPRPPKPEKKAPETPAGTANPDAPSADPSAQQVSATESTQPMGDNPVTPETESISTPESPAAEPDVSDEAAPAGEPEMAANPNPEPPAAPEASAPSEPRQESPVTPAHQE